MAIALVTGGSRGIGRATALLLAQEGYTVAVNYQQNLHAAQEVMNLITQAGGKAFVLQADISDENQVIAMFTAIDQHDEPLAALVNNAGITRDNLIMKMSEDDFDAVVATNLKGAFNCVKHVSRQMLKQRSGRIINISSVSGVMGNAGQANYCASKAGLIGLTKSLAKELAGRDITVNAVAPGLIETDMTAALPEAVRTGMLHSIPAGRAGKPEDVANAAAFFAAEQSSYLTGQVLCVDGGMAM